MSTTYTEPTSTEQILDTETLWERRDYLWEKYSDLLTEGTCEKWKKFSGNIFSDALSDEDFEDWKAAGHPLDWLNGEDSECGELHALNTLHSEIGSWDENNTMVLESHFTEYAESWVRGLHDIPTMLDGCIDWNKFADSLRSEWSTIDFMGEEYLVQNS